MQRSPSVGRQGRTHAVRHQAVTGQPDRGGTDVGNAQHSCRPAQLAALSTVPVTACRWRQLARSTQSRPSGFSKAALRLDRPRSGLASTNQPFVTTGTRPGAVTRQATHFRSNKCGHVCPAAGRPVDALASMSVDHVPRGATFGVLFIRRNTSTTLISSGPHIFQVKAPFL